MGGWLTLPLGRLRLRLRVETVLVAGVLLAVADDLGLRYLLLLTTLLVHEGAHAGTALALGGARAEIRLWPWFGRADVPRLGGRREAAVALAAPATNLAVAAVLILAFDARVTLALGRCPLPDLLATAHLAMGAANLLPVPPIDGGRALRALRRAPPPASPAEPGDGREA